MNRKKSAGFGLILALIVALFLFAPLLQNLVIDWLWFGEVGYRAVFATLLGTRLVLGLTFGVLLAALLYVNVFFAQKSAPMYIPRPGAPQWHQTASHVARGSLNAMLAMGSIVLGLLGGMVAASRWDDWLRFRNGESFGVQDPLLRMDIGFYLFQYPFLRFVESWIVGALVLATLATAAVYYVHGALDFSGSRPRVAGAARVHLCVLLGFTFLAKAFDYWLDRFSLLISPGNALFGAGYTDVHARLPALNILIVVAVLAAVGFFAGTRFRTLVVPVVTALVMGVVSITAGVVYPSLVQRFTVGPNEQERERQYITHHLRATRQAYGLDKINSVEYALGRPLSNTDIKNERATLDNVRLWDYRVLSETFQGLQRLRDYYDVRAVDIDRYVVNGQYRQVMLAPRELAQDRLGTRLRSWVNRRLQYTHGYGLVMSAVNEADSAGRPVWFVQDLPLKTEAGVEVERPQIYYGMQPQPVVVAPSQSKEFDYPLETGSAVSTYEGAGGIPLDAYWKRLLFGTALGDWNTVISSQINSQSRVLIRRHVLRRVASVAPFLKFDGDPYMVNLDGKLVWVLDAYTVASSYPYSDPSLYRDTLILEPGEQGLEETTAGSYNYIRNPVKLMVDAYDGSITFFTVDDSDPLLRCYARAFPNLFRPASEIPTELRAHFRYPADLFTTQAQKWARFHMDGPDEFYLQSDVWQVPVERLAAGDAAVSEPMQPYYVIMRLPGETEEEFVLILPFKTRNGTTMPGWLTGRCDGENYGELRLYRFAANSQVDAPEQVDAAIQSNPEITERVSLLNREGSRVRYGNLLVLPIGGTLLYVKPFFTEASRGNDQGGGIPVLKNVILAEKRGNALKVVMRPTFSDALADLIGAPVTREQVTNAGREPGERGGAPSPAGGSEVSRLASDAEAAYNAAEQAQRSGDWAEYGRQLQRLRDSLQRLRALTEGQ